ncbi:MAG: alpha/beta hydrolase [Gemmatimonadales bacterium]
MQEHSFSTPRSARYFTLGSPAATEIWFVCHGYGQLAGRFLERFRALEAEGRCIVAPEGLSRFYLTESASARRVGASWMTREDRAHEIEDYVRYLDALHQAIVARSAKVTVLGFSQAAATVCRWAALGSARIDRLIVWGGEVPPDLDLRQAAGRLRACNLTLVYGTRDEFFTPKIVAATEARLREHDVAFARISYDGKHEIHEGALRQVADARIQPIA